MAKLKIPNVVHLVEADAKKVTEACHKYICTKRIHPDNETTIVALNEFIFENPASVFEQLLPMQKANTTKLMILPAKNCCVIMHDYFMPDPNLICHLSKKLLAKAYVVQYGQDKNRTVSLSYWFKKPQPVAMLASMKDKVTIKLGLNHLNVSEPLTKFTCKDLIRILAGLGFHIEDEKFYLASKRSIAQKISL